MISADPAEVCPLYRRTQTAVFPLQESKRLCVCRSVVPVLKVIIALPSMGPILMASGPAPSRASSCSSQPQSLSPRPQSLPHHLQGARYFPRRQNEGRDDPIPLRNHDCNHVIWDIHALCRDKVTGLSFGAPRLMSYVPMQHAAPMHLGPSRSPEGARGWAAGKCSGPLLFC